MTSPTVIIQGATAENCAPLAPGCSAPSQLCDRSRYAISAASLRSCDAHKSAMRAMHHGLAIAHAGRGLNWRRPPIDFPDRTKLALLEPSS